MKEKKYICLKCTSFFGVWGKKVSKYGGFVNCCPKCGNVDRKFIQRNFGFGWTKLRIGIIGVVVILIGFVVSIFFAPIGFVLIASGFITSLSAILITSE
ncbi:hypothetical protein AYK25_08395 [Thermoplasmatales archaeon SM1-50]|nr:MAG: hypothetical protein AYK25_08395 [Thermoplasmatales archaeon SM1-50]